MIFCLLRPLIYWLFYGFFFMENVQHVVTKKIKIKKNLFIFKSFNMQETEIKMVNIAGFVVYMEFGWKSFLSFLKKIVKPCSACDKCKTSYKVCCLNLPNSSLGSSTRIHVIKIFSYPYNTSSKEQWWDTQNQPWRPHMSLFHKNLEFVDIWETLRQWQ